MVERCPKEKFGGVVSVVSSYDQSMRQHATSFMIKKLRQDLKDRLPGYIMHVVTGIKRSIACNLVSFVADTVIRKILAPGQFVQVYRDLYAMQLCHPGQKNRSCGRGGCGKPQVSNDRASRRGYDV
nr:hypothetical protein CFP56_09353 [Quercus suber]POE77720.1 hypothetical protein CFP56_09363 [Quercus suber]